ncbi:MAG: hypothetical protein ACETVR_01305 [Candidatus Bathyarchaeia archaeon]
MDRRPGFTIYLRGSQIKKALKNLFKTEEEKRLTAELRKIRVFFGSIEEFEETMGFKVSVVDLGSSVIGLTYDKKEYEGGGNPFHRYSLEEQRKIVEGGVIALVNANYSRTETFYTPEEEYLIGTPVKKAQK